jgi:uncharacterized membrane protein
MLNAALLFAILSPCVYGLMNVVDKSIVVHRVKFPIGFTVVTGLVNLIFGLVIAVFLDWSKITFYNIVFPVLAGIFFACQFFLYFKLMQSEDVSNLIGFVYVYPIIVALLSFLLLHEILPFIGYVGVFLIIFGVLVLSMKSMRRTKQVWWMIFGLAVFVAFYEFVIKVSTLSLSPWNGVAINHMVVGCTIMLVLFSAKYRREFRHEFTNIRWAFLSETLTVLATLFLFLAMSGLPATIVSSVAATQPLAVLVFEQIFAAIGFHVIRDTSILKKAVPIALIVAGVFLLYLPELMG